MEYKVVLQSEDDAIVSSDTLDLAEAPKVGAFLKLDFFTGEELEYLRVVGVFREEIYVER